jgi:uncharacterized protein YkwD
MPVPKRLKPLITDKPFLLACLGLIIILCFCYYSGHREIVIMPTTEERILFEVNKLRIAKGLEKLTSDARIAEIARHHSLMMAAGVIPVGHVNSNQRFAAIAQSGIDWVAAAENVACVTRFEDPVSEVFRWWLSCKSDQQNMEGKYNRTGIAVAKSKTKGDYYITQIYIKTP